MAPIYVPAFIAMMKPKDFGRDKILRISEADRNFVNDFYMSDSSITFACAGRMLELHLVSLTKFKENAYASKNVNVGLNDVVEGGGCIGSTDGYISTEDLMPGHFFKENTSKMKIKIDRNFELSSVITKANFHSLTCAYNDYKLISNGTALQFINGLGQVVFQIAFSSRTAIVGSHFIDTQDDAVYFVSITNLR